MRLNTFQEMRKGCPPSINASDLSNCLLLYCYLLVFFFITHVFIRNALNINTFICGLAQDITMSLFRRFGGACCLYFLITEVNLQVTEVTLVKWQVFHRRFKNPVLVTRKM